MTKNTTLIIFALVLFLAGLASVSAADNSTVLTDDIACEDVIQLSLEVGDEIELAGEDSVLAAESAGQIIVSEGNSIQKAIDDAEEGSTIIVEKGDYAEDLIISKGLSIVGRDANLKSKSTAFNILKTANNTSVSGFNIAVSDADGTGILINASNCRITDNKITGGANGILADYHISNNTGELEIYVINNTTILRNIISNVAGSGISIASYNPIVYRNRVTDIVNTRENGTAIGIRANGMGIIPDDLKVNVTKNYISNVRSAKDSAYGLDIGGNSVFDTLVQFDIFDNIVEKVKAAVEAVGVNVGVFSLNTTLPTVNVRDLDITGISGDGENSTATGLSVSITTIGQNETSDGIVENISINNIKASGENSKATGIDATGVGLVDIYVSDNSINNVKASKSATGISATGIDYTNFEAFISVSNNNISNIDSSKTKGINLMSLGNGEIRKNLMQNLPGKGTTFITGVTLSIGSNSTNITIPQNATIEDIEEFLMELGNLTDSINITIEGNLTVTGNNLEGTGVETGFAVVRPSQIHYNRAVNLKYNVVKESTRKFILESYDYDPSMSNEELAYLMLKSQEMFENCTEEELRNMSVSMGAFLDKFFAEFDNETAGDVDARFNWWGSNLKPSKSKFKSRNGKIIYDPWLILRVNSNPKIIEKGQYSKITADVYMDSKGKDHSSDAELYFSGPKVTLSTDKGSFNGKKSIILNWTNGKAVAYLKGDEYGLATVTASDYETASTTVLVVGKYSQNKVAKAENAKMRPAGNPLVLLLAGVILLCAGTYRKR